jgi:alkaline phosphatase
MTEDGYVAKLSDRDDLTNVDTQDPEYLQPSLVPLESETHGGTDVAAYATGPRSYLMRGVVEQNYIFHVIDYALDLTNRATR